MVTPRKVPIRIGLIGTGGITDQWLAPALAKVTDAEAWSVLSRDLTKGAAFAARHGLKAPQPAYSDIDSFLSDPLLDAVIIASPDALHAAQALACVQASKPRHIFVEKPMTTDSASCSQLIAACQANHVRLAVGYHLRWHQGHRLLRQAINEGKLGQIRHMDIQWTYNSSPSDWRASSEMGKWWSLAAVGTHAIDLVVWLLGPTCGAVVEQNSIISSPVYGGPHDETAIVSLRFASGATAQVVSSVIFKAPRTAHIYGTAGSAVLEGTFGPYGAGKITVAGDDLDFPHNNPYVGELTDFVRAIKAGSEPEADGSCGLLNVQHLEKAVAAGQTVTL